MSAFEIVDAVRDVRMETPHGRFFSGAVRLREPSGRESEHVLLYRGVTPSASCLVRLNSACMTSELFGCKRCDCAWQLAETLRMFGAEESCALVYTQTDEGRGHGIIAKLRTFLDSDGTAASGLHRRYVEARDIRNFQSQAFAAHWLGVRRARLVSDNRSKWSALAEQGITVTDVLGLRLPDESLRELYRYKDRLSQ